ncbi:PP2C family protein-serine/threonine phosphatase [Elstera litoralis]|uniref:PP2C family protein-serine/threonine phosphatase n=1 Tax=Elstera litoralis TaxID=552518 RepID=UPI000698568B|nr:SpoIIE family protein phosphatase [Elstera litoralis]
MTNPPTSLNLDSSAPPTAAEEGLVQRATFATGQDIVREGDPGDCFYFIEEGSVEVFKSGPGGALKLGETGAGGLFGEMALIDNKPRMATVRAKEPTTCRIFPAAILSQSLEGSDSLVQMLLKLFVKNIRNVANLQMENRRLLSELTQFRDRVSDELEVARRMQLDLQPSAGEIAEISDALNIQISARLAPSTEVGGDLWTAFSLPNGKLGIFLGDLTGHGVVAAVNAFRLHALLADLRDHAQHPGHFMTLLNRRLSRLLPFGQFAAAFYCVVDPQAGLIHYTGAAWEAAVVYDRDTGITIPLSGTGLPLGVSEHEVYIDATMPLPLRSRVLVYSDALSECFCFDGARVAEAEFNRWRDAALAEDLDLPEGLLRRLTENQVRHLDDDLTIVAATVEHNAPLY